MRFMTAAFTVLALSGTAMAQTPAPADDSFSLPVKMSDGAAVRQICDFARTSATVNLETAQQVASYCVDFLKRIDAAKAAAVQAAKKE